MVRFAEHAGREVNLPRGTSMTRQAQPAVSIVPHSLYAVLDNQPAPGRLRSFHVTIELEVEATWTVELVASVPQGINPLIKLLRFNVVCPAGTSSGIVRRTLRYSETPPGANYSEVWLGDGDMAISARVSVVT